MRASKSSLASPSQKVSEPRFQCRHCRQSVLFPADPGEAENCPVCGAVNVLPLPGRLLAFDIFFACGRCEQRLAVGNEAEGAVVDCPSCAQPVTVPTISSSHGADLPAVQLTADEIAFLSERRPA